MAADISKLDPQAKAILDMMAEQEGPKMSDLPPPEARAMYKAMGQMMEPQDLPIGKVEDRTIPGPGGDIPIRLYTPVAADSGLPLILFFHGGGWVIGDLESHDALCRTLANEVGAKVVAVDYRLAPENKFPAAVEDCYAALKWAEAHAGDIGADANRIAVAGDSAGGNLAAVIAQKAKAEKGPALAMQLLIYPVTDRVASRQSYVDCAEGFLLEKEGMDWFYDCYMDADTDPADPALSPLRAADLSGLPPAYVVTAGFDVLRDEGTEYAANLKAAGVPVTHVNYDGMIHGFFNMQNVLAVSKPAIQDAAAALKAAFA